MKNYESTIKALHDQADALGEDDRESRTVTERLNSIDKRYQELQELAKLRKQRLLDALSLYKLFTEADGVEQWINEKENKSKNGSTKKTCAILAFFNPIL